MVPKSLPKGKPQVKHVYIQCLLIHWCGRPVLTPQSKEAGHPTIAPDSGAMTETRSEPISQKCGKEDKSQPIPLMILMGCRVLWKQGQLHSEDEATALAPQTRKFSLMMIQQNLMLFLPPLCLIKILESAFEWLPFGGDKGNNHQLFIKHLLDS